MNAQLVAAGALDANLNALGERNKEFAALIRNARPHSNLEFESTPQGYPSVKLHGKLLCSRHRPIDEADRLVKDIDLVDHAVIVCLGFGGGYHVMQLAKRMRHTGIIIVFEPDIALLRSMYERIDMSSWLRQSNIVWMTDPADRAALATRLKDAESIIAMGVDFLEHPPSRARIGNAATKFTSLFGEFVTATKTTFVTTLLRSIDTVRNLIMNVDHYALGAGAADLRDRARGYPAVIVSAGPSGHRNLHRLAQPGVRDRCIIIAAQTMLKPLIERGIKPHFITALDYHEISKRFYEGLTAEDVDGVTLIADPKAHPVIIDSFPGNVRCCHSPLLDLLLGDLARDMGDLPPGATVAHLAAYVARFMGCNPIAIVGQDLAFTDALYYTPGTAIHDVWAPELNLFNTIEMMEWQRIARHRVHLHEVEDIYGRKIFTDAQMLTYLQQFERDFAEFEQQGITVFDATEGGVRKRHTTIKPLVDFLHDYATKPLPDLSIPDLDEERVQRERMVLARLAKVAGDVRSLRSASMRSSKIVTQMKDHKDDLQRIRQLTQKLRRFQADLNSSSDAFRLVNHINQMGAFKRIRADRKLDLEKGAQKSDMQMARYDRDDESLRWISDAAEEMLRLLTTADRIVKGECITRIDDALKLPDSHAERRELSRQRVAVIVPVDVKRDGLGRERSLAETIGGRTILQLTLERLAQCQRIESIILLTESNADIESLFDQSTLAIPVHIERFAEPLFGPEQAVIAAARAWAPTSWRGSIAGLSVYDEIFCPRAMLVVMDRHSLTAALIAGPDWTCIDPSEATGCDAVVARYLEHPDKQNFVFTQAPPGMCGCVINRKLMEEMVDHSRLATIGALLVYQPHAPQGDPIARDMNVQIDHDVRRAMVRTIADSPRHIERLRRLAATGTDPALMKSQEFLSSILTDEHRSEYPHHVILELTPRRRDRGFLYVEADGVRPDLGIETAHAIFDQIPDASRCTLTVGGFGDPLCHDRCMDVLHAARKSGFASIHIRTALLVETDVLDALLTAAPDVISIDLHADRAATYATMMGVDRFKQVLENIDYLHQHRRRVTDHSIAAAIAAPWIIPRLCRCRTTLEDIDSFFDRWQHILGTAIIEGPPAREALGTQLDLHEPDTPFAQTDAPARVHIDQLMQRMVILSDGSAPVSEADLNAGCAGNITTRPLRDVWSETLARRNALLETPGETSPLLRTNWP